MNAYPLKPELECDLVMKGGVTSGVIYPGVVQELARVYRFRSVGGASAGAIAAAATAAAEYRRQREGAGEGAPAEPAGFERLETLPGRLTTTCRNGYSVLFNLFQPVTSSARLFGLVAAMITSDGGGSGALVRALIRRYWLRVLIGVLLGAAVVGLGIASGQVVGWVAGVIGGLALLVLVAAVLVVAGLLGDVGRLERFGLCSGMPGVPLRGSRRRRKGVPHDAPNPEALVPWLHRELQCLAGLDPDGPPLTFGDLRKAGIELRMMTTNLTRSQPVTMPWVNRHFFFDRAEFATMFPASVVTWMIDTEEDAGMPAAGVPAGRHRWPVPDDVPVIVATRMSLSFPGFIQAVPLYAVNWTYPADPGETRPMEKNWFSDGGICANLPVHLFDSPIPTRPTFAINLDPFGPTRERSKDERDNSYLPTGAGGGRFRPWRTLAESGLGGLTGFLGAVVATARNWVDEGQLTVPGYSGRVVTIFQAADEGGFNLDMSAKDVADLSERGAGAGDRLIAQFATPTEPGGVSPGWRAHRWTRMRLSLAGYQQWAARFAAVYDTDGKVADPVTYRGLFDLPPAQLGAYRPSAASLHVLGEYATEIASDGATWNAASIENGAPAASRRPTLRLVPELDENQTVQGASGG